MSHCYPDNCDTSELNLKSSKHSISSSIIDYSPGLDQVDAKGVTYLINSGVTYNNNINSG